MTITLVDICATGFSIIDEKFMETVCHILKIQPQYLTKPKFIQRFDGRAAKYTTHVIYPMLSVGKYTESLTSLLIINLRQYSRIVDCL